MATAADTVTQTPTAPPTNNTASTANHGMSIVAIEVPAEGEVVEGPHPLLPKRVAAAVAATGITQEVTATTTITTTTPAITAEIGAGSAAITAAAAATTPLTLHIRETSAACMYHT
ncbi:hypothetical protein EV182_002868 [Spiromyces aspiralis]|uniref:Uncharacterized protein n=1 Tax=Spiromyces aspiralis TaxID=68401 RepID=A0ACC1HHE9_9FUNG|nr:hypothetical protein EV182_002868 [Spiromyces aspiralis]